MAGIQDMMNKFRNQMTESPPQYFTVGAGGQRTYTPQYTGENNAPLTQAQWQRQYGQSSRGGSPAVTQSGGGTPSAPSAPSIDTSGPINAINQGYDAYFRQLDEIMNSSLPSQRTAQENIATSQFEQGKSNLTTQKDIQQQGLEGQKRTVTGQQKKTLADIANNIRNSLMAGNIYLGARGAGDSSAANQYSYALTKMGSQQRGDVNAQYAEIQNQIMDRENALATTFAGAMKDLEFQKNQKISEIASWFSEQQNALRQAQASGQLNKAKDLATISQNMLQMAMQQLQTVQAEAANRRTMLDQWAINNATTIEGLKKNLTSVGSQVGYTNPQAQPLAGINQQTGSSALPLVYGYGKTDERDKTYLG